MPDSWRILAFSALALAASASAAGKPADVARLAGRFSELARGAQARPGDLEAIERFVADFQPNDPQAQPLMYEALALARELSLATPAAAPQSESERIKRGLLERLATAGFAVRDGGAIAHPAVGSRMAQIAAEAGMIGDAASAALSGVRFPPEAATYLDANPGYTSAPAPGGPTREELYVRERVEPDLRGLLPHLPEAPGAVLDIGSGIGVIDLPIHRLLGRPRLVLVDKARREIGGGVHDVVGIARNFLEMNGVEAAKIRTIDPQDPRFERRLRRAGRFGLILSLRALGYMFPYDVYAELLREVAAPGAHIILDLQTMDAERLRQRHHPIVYERFAKAGLGSVTAQNVMRRIEEELGPVEAIGRGRDYVRVLVKVRG